MRTLLTLAALEDWGIQALDIKPAYLYGKLDEEIYMEQPGGFVKDKTKVRWLHCSLYGLKKVAYPGQKK